MKDNKLIAEFMGIESFKDSLASLHQGKINVDVDVYEQAQYHTSWNWLMPVVEQIENFGFEFIIAESRVKIKHNTDLSINELLNIDIVGSKIDATYKAVVEFINQLDN